MLSGIFNFVKRFKYPLFLLIITIIFFNRILFYPNQIVYPGGDIGATFSFEKNYLIKNVMLHHGLPFWNPYSFSGVPFVATSSTAIFYPVNLLFFLFQVDQTFGYIFVLDIFFIGLFTYYFGRQIKLKEFTALFFACIFMFSAPITTRFIAGHIFILDTLVWFPLLLTLYERYIQKEQVSLALFASIPIALMLLAGSAQFALYEIGISIFYLVLRYGFEKKLFSHYKTIIRLLAISLLFGLFIASVQLLPTGEFSQLSTRARGISFGFASRIAFHPYQMLTFFLPFFFGQPEDPSFWGKIFFHEGTGYIGIIPLFFLFFNFFRKKNCYVNIFIIFCVLSLLYAVGKYFPLFYLTFKFFPIIGAFRVPSRVLFITSFSLSGLAAFGIESFINIRNQQKKKIFLLLSACFFIGLIIFLSALFLTIYPKGFYLYETLILRSKYAIGVPHHSLFNSFLMDFYFLGIALILTSILSFFFLKKYLTNFWFKIFILLLFLLNSWFFLSSFVKTAEYKTVFPGSEIGKYLKKDPELFRTFDFTGFLISSLEKENLQQVTGIHSFQLARYRDFLWLLGDHNEDYNEGFFWFKNIKNFTISNMVNAKYILSIKKLSYPQLEAVYQTNEHMQNSKVKYYIYKNIFFLPRAYVVPSAIYVQSDKNALHLLENKSFDPRKTVILSTKPDIPLNNTGSTTSVKIVTYSPDKITLDLNLKSPGFLVLSEIWYPAWKAYDNQKEVKIIRANYTFRALSLTKGKHSIVFEYKSTSFYLGLFLSIFAIIILIVWLLFLHYKAPNKYENT